MEDKILNSFLTQQKESLNKQNSLTRYYSTYLRFIEGFLVITTTAQGVRAGKIEMQVDINTGKKINIIILNYLDLAISLECLFTLVNLKRISKICFKGTLF